MGKYEYDAVVIGGGAAGLTASGIAAHFGAKTLMVEAERLGGDCTWTGCVPSKALLKAGKVAHHIRKAGHYGLTDTRPNIDTAKVMRHIRNLREEVYEEADDPAIYRRMGVEVLEGRARFSDAHTVYVTTDDGTQQKVTSRYFFICTGAHAAVPPVEGIRQVPYLTSESLFEMERLPEKLIIIGGGNVGTEMAQAIRRLGSEVTVIETSDHILGHDDPELAGILFDILKAEGISYHLNVRVSAVSYKQERIEVSVETGRGEKSLSGDALLIATGREPNIDGLGLDSAGIQYSDKGVEVNERCQTNVKHIYACGDITGEYQFTHMSEHMAKVAATNALLRFPMEIDRDHVPWCTYTDPELAHVGATEEQLKKKGQRYETFRFPYSKLDRALTESEGEGLIKIHAKKWSGKILGASVVGARAGEVISEYALAMKNGVSLRNIADTIHPYPTYGLGARRAADQWYIRRQSEWSVKLIQKVFGYRGKVPDFSDPERIV